MIKTTKISRAKWILIASLFFLQFTNPIFAKDEDPCSKTNKIIDFIQTFHIDPPAIDEAFNEQVLKTFLEQLDPIGYILTANDADSIQSLCPNLPVIDCNSHKDFIQKISTLYANRLQRIDSVVLACAEKPMSSISSDTLYFPDIENASYDKSESQLYLFWEKYFRFQMLRFFITTYKQGDTLFQRNSQNFDLHEPEIRARVTKQEKCKIEHLKNMDGNLENYILSSWLNAVTMSFDPHTNYFSQQEKEQFDHMLSRNKFSLGIDLDQNRNGDILIARLVPGGPAWRSNELDEGDVILSIQFENKEVVDLTCSNLYEIENLIYQSEAEEATIRVRNNFGQVKTVQLKMEMLEAAENVVYSFIMDGKCKIGYITLPAFYTDPDSYDPLGCASDLVKELVKLKEDNVEGIMLDVRNNGGGSITEAVDLAGVFIDSGPLCLYTNKTSKPILVNDINRGVIYDGPLVVMVNQMSASASEIFAGILQDYNRAVVVGQPTYGKATGQNILAVGDNKNGNSDVFKYDPTASDFVKVTTARYFNLSGGSHQLTGIKPDISLPVVFSYEGYLESGSETALPNIQVEREVNFEPWPKLPVDTLQLLSEERLATNPEMQKFVSLGASVEKLYTQKADFPLDYDQFYNYYMNGLNMIKTLDSALALPASAYTILNNTFDADLLMYDEYKQKVHKEMIKKINKNLFIEEGYKVLCDMIRIENVTK